MLSVWPNYYAVGNVGLYTSDEYGAIITLGQKSHLKASDYYWKRYQGKSIINIDSVYAMLCSP